MKFQDFTTSENDEPELELIMLYIRVDHAKTAMRVFSELEPRVSEEDAKAVSNFVRNTNACIQGFEEGR